MLVRSYIGGALNFASLAAALAVPGSALAGAMAVDNLAMAGFLAGGEHRIAVQSWPKALC